MNLRNIESTLGPGPLDVLRGTKKGFQPSAYIEKRSQIKRRISPACVFIQHTGDLAESVGLWSDIPPNQILTRPLDQLNQHRTAGVGVSGTQDTGILSVHHCLYQYAVSVFSRVAVSC